MEDLVGQLLAAGLGHGEARDGLERVARAVAQALDGVHLEGVRLQRGRAELRAHGGQRGAVQVCLEGERQAGADAARRAADAVDIGRRRAREIKVQHVAHVLEVNAARHAVLAVARAGAAPPAAAPLLAVARGGPDRGA